VALGVVRDLRSPRSLSDPAEAAAYQEHLMAEYVLAAVRRVGITAQDLRADRLHDEAQASGGDPLRLTHLFGISDPTAIRYCAESGTLDQAAGHTGVRAGR
jgi:hypothetical protein